MTLGHGLLRDRSHPDGDQSPQQNTVQFRTAEAVRPAGGSSTVIDMRLALPVGGEVPPSFTVEGLNIETGVLPLREEAYVEMTMVGDGLDMLEDAPGGPLPPDESITLAEVLEERGIEYGEIRQRGLTQTDEGDQDPVHTMEAAVTVRVLE